MHEGARKDVEHLFGALKKPKEGDISQFVPEEAHQPENDLIDEGVVTDKGELEEGVRVKRWREKDRVALKCRMRPRGLKSIFVGYAKDSKSYRSLDLGSNVIVESRDVDFFENKFHYDSTSTNEIVTQTPQDISGPNLKLTIREAESSSAHRRSERARKKRNLDHDFIDSQAIIFLIEGDNENNVINKIPVLLNVEDAPETYKEAVTSRNSAFWKKAIDDEIDSLVSNNTWELSNLPSGSKAIGCRWMKDMNKVDTILGIKVKRHSGGYALNQCHYIDKIIDKFQHLNIEEANTHTSHLVNWLKMMEELLLNRICKCNRGMHIQSILCPCCDMAAETSNHLFFTCSMVRDIYRKFATWRDIKLMEVASFEVDGMDVHYSLSWNS
uniref:Zinc finger, CCHC-type n=1 Tax=Tanacetum cinerariifolium TaxID=118510 RepID=A0A6L2N617_TANCI|nr:zinc finger, CCHC-type [Tanacetum cinerariifolium]